IFRRLMHMSTLLVRLLRSFENIPTRFAITLLSMCACFLSHSQLVIPFVRFGTSSESPERLRAEPRPLPQAFGDRANCQTSQPDERTRSCSNPHRLSWSGTRGECLQLCSSRAGLPGSLAAANN